jgi:hypothetical protein
MALALGKVHVFATIEGIPQPQIVEEHHYIRLRGDGAEYPLYIQGGRVFAENGPEVAADELPEWFDVELAKCSPQALAAVGWGTGEPGTTRRR